MKSKITTIKISICLVLVVITNLATGQPLTGRVINMETGDAIEYVNVGIPQKDLGTICDRDGNFMLDIKTELDSCYLFFSCIGYQDTSLLIADLKKSDNNIISLNKKHYTLNEIVIGPDFRKRKKIGVIKKCERQKNNLVFSLNKDSCEETRKGVEFGILIKNRKRFLLFKKRERLLLSDMYLPIKKCDFDSILLRINFNQVKGKMIYKYLPKEITNKIEDDEDVEFSFNQEYLEESKTRNLINVSRQPIYIKFFKDSFPKDGVTIDLTPYNLAVHGNIFVGVELVEAFGYGKVSFYAEPGDTFYKPVSFADWVLFPGIAPAISLNAIVLKKHK